MKVYGPSEIRNLAVIGHGGTGKTSLCASLLHSSGAVTRLGRVEDGTTVTDYDPEEIDRGLSLQVGACHMEWKKQKLNALDTPGFAAFLFDAKVSLRVAETGLLVVCGVGGVEVGTEKTWGWANEFDTARLIVVNRLDRERSDFRRVLGLIQEKLSRAAVAVQLPLGSEHDFRGVVDLIDEKAYTYETDGSGRFTEGPVPDAMKDAVTEERRRLVEMVAEIDEKLMETYFDKGTLERDDLVAGLRQGIRARRIFPVFCAAATKNIGAHPILDALATWFPSPADAGEVKGTDPRTKEPATRKPSASEAYSAYVFKTIADPFAGRITLFRVVSGKIQADTAHYNPIREVEERFGPVFLLQGKEQVKVAEVQAGDIGAVAKLRETVTGDTVADKAHPIVYPSVAPPEPSISFALEPKNKGDEDKISTALHKIMEEDLTLKLERDAQTKEMLVSGTGDIHVESVVQKLKKRYGVEVVLKPPKVPYRETIRKKAEVQGRHKKQTGGRGQFADVWIRFEPQPRGKGFEFVDEIFGGSVPRQYIPAVEKGLNEVKDRGILAGYPVVDFRAILYDGSYHTVDSSEMAFKVASHLAFRKGIEAAGPTLLEPIMNVEVTAPDDKMGDIMGDLNSRRGRVQGMDSGAGGQIIRAQVPMAEMLSYSATLKSITGGRGEYHMEFSHYEEVPSQLQSKIVAAAAAARGKVVADEEE